MGAGDPEGDAGEVVPAAWGDRRARLAERLARRNLDAWLLVPGPDLTYLTGLQAEPSERVLVAAWSRDGAAWAVVPQFEAPRVRSALGPDVHVVGYRDETGPEPAMARAFAPFASRAAAFGATFGAMRLLERTAVEGAVPRARWHPIDADCAALRQLKEPAELQQIRRAALIAGRAVAAGLRAAVPGATERDVEAACNAVLLAHRTSSPFPVAVASGPRAADPHAGTSQRRLRAGEPCWIDLGARCGGYCADVTRTCVVPGLEPDPEVAAALAAVRAAHAAALAAVRPGATAEAVDAAARESIAAAGLGAYFPHRTGHGLGLAIHEAPFLVDGNAEPLQVGMVFTVEPGVYLPGRGGVRLEDDVAVTSGGPEVLTDGA